MLRLQQNMKSIGVGKCDFGSAILFQPQPTSQGYCEENKRIDALGMFTTWSYI